MLRDSPHSHNFHYSVLVSWFLFLVILTHPLLCLHYKFSFILGTRAQEKIQHTEGVILPAASGTHKGLGTQVSRIRWDYHTLSRPELSRSRKPRELKKVCEKEEVRKQTRQQDAKKRNMRFQRNSLHFSGRYVIRLPRKHTVKSTLFANAFGHAYFEEVKR